MNQDQFVEALKADLDRLVPPTPNPNRARYGAAAGLSGLRFATFGFAAGLAAALAFVLLSPSTGQMRATLESVIKQPAQEMQPVVTQTGKPTPKAEPSDSPEPAESSEPATKGSPEPENENGAVSPSPEPERDSGEATPSAAASESPEAGH